MAAQSKKKWKNKSVPMEKKTLLRLFGGGAKAFIPFNSSAREKSVGATRVAQFQRVDAGRRGGQCPALPGNCASFSGIVPANQLPFSLLIPHFPSLPPSLS
jgi:hypothetical protein